jgi:hypothetical protein
MFKKALIPALALVAASVALPAAAQSYDRGYRDHDRYEQRGDYGWQSINQRQNQLDRRIDRGVRNGSLTRREAGRLREDFYALARLEASYRRNGLSRWERNDLDARFDRLSARIRYERRDDDRRGRDYDGYGRDHDGRGRR